MDELIFKLFLKSSELKRQLLVKSFRHFGLVIFEGKLILVDVFSNLLDHFVDRWDLGSDIGRHRFVCAVRIWTDESIFGQMLIMKLQKLLFYLGRILFN